MGRPSRSGAWPPRAPARRAWPTRSESSPSRTPGTRTTARSGVRRQAGPIHPQGARSASLAPSALPESPHVPGVLPGPRPLGAIDRQHLRVRRTLVQRDLEGIRVLLDEPSQGVPVLHGCRPRTDLVPPHLTARHSFVHRPNLRAAHPRQGPRLCAHDRRPPPHGPACRRLGRGRRRPPLSPPRPPRPWPAVRVAPRRTAGRRSGGGRVPGPPRRSRRGGRRCRRRGCWCGGPVRGGRGTVR